MNDADSTEHRKNKVLRAINALANLISITFVSSEIKDSDVRIRFNPKGGNMTHIGMQHKGKKKDVHTMNLACLSDTKEFEGTEESAILHQFAHMLGMTHEHPADMPLDVQGTLIVTRVAVHRSCNAFSVTNQLYSTVWQVSEAEIKLDIIGVYNDKNLPVTNFLEYDSGSLMRCVPVTYAATC